MLYEKKRTFTKAPIDLAAVALAKDAVVYAGLTLSTVAATAGTIDYEAENQQVFSENTIEFIGWETADSALDTATLAVSLQSSEDPEADVPVWKDEVTMVLPQAEIVLNKLIRRFTVPSGTGQHMRLKLVVGTEVFTAGGLLAVVRPL